MAPERNRYIPVGCILISQPDLGLKSPPWTAGGTQAWFNFCQDAENATQGHDHNGCLPAQVQARFIEAPRFFHLSLLFRSHWARLEARLCSVRQAAAVIRVYLLPDDVGRGEVDRTDSTLVHAKKAVLAKLGYSELVWSGLRMPFSLDPVRLSDLGRSETDKGMSLLEVFNRIPSPNPDVNTVNEPRVQDAMYNLFESSPAGLKTRLHPYQRRLAALMLQKETQSEWILDPRLVPVTSSAGRIWYIDPVAGTVLSEPRYYDGVRGGILAEEMGAGKTLICLALVLASRDLPANPPRSTKAASHLSVAQWHLLRTCQLRAPTEMRLPGSITSRPGSSEGLSLLVVQRPLPVILATTCFPCRMCSAAGDRPESSPGGKGWFFSVRLLSSWRPTICVLNGTPRLQNTPRGSGCLYYLAGTRSFGWRSSSDLTLYYSLSPGSRGLASKRKILTSPRWPRCTLSAVSSMRATSSATRGCTINTICLLA